MSRVRCPQERCSFWMNGWCDADEIELDLATLSCITFDEIELADELLSVVAETEDEDDELDLEWVDDESIFEDDMDESLYGVDDGDPDFADDEEEMPEEEDPWQY